MKHLQRSLIVVALMVFMVACNISIPSGFRGDFVDQTRGVSIHLESSKAQIVKEGRVIDGQAVEVDVAKMALGQPGIYLRDNPTNKNIVEMYWINPNAATRQEAAGVVWFESEVIYARFEKKMMAQASDRWVATGERGANASRFISGSKVGEFSMVHVMNGQLGVDVVTKTWQVGWPEKPQTYRFSRTK